MSDDAPPPTPQIDLQDPLPESNWFWRRVFVFVSITILFAGVSYILWQIADIGHSKAPRAAIDALLELGLRILWLSFIYVMFYLIAPSAEQVVKMIQTAALLRSNVQFASRSVQEADGRTEIAQTAGKPPQPVAPPMTGIPPSTSGRGLPDEPSWSKPHG